MTLNELIKVGTGIVNRYTSGDMPLLMDGQEGDLRMLLTEFARELRRCRSRRSMEELEQFGIVDYCLENHRDRTGACYLADAFKDIHDRYGWRYADIHKKFKREVDSRNDVYITRSSDIFVRDAERKQLPIYNNQWYSHLMKR